MNYIMKSVRVFARVFNALTDIERPTDEILAQYPYIRIYG